MGAVSVAITNRPDDSTTGKHIPALDGVRGLAILAVLYCHVFWSNPDPAGSIVVHFLARSREAGWVGVDLFFVLSGFLITGILYDTMSSRHFFRNFYARRLLRIFPLYYGFFALLFIITFFRGERWFAGVFTYLTYTENLFLRPLAVTNAYWININHFWSLAIEEQFYLVWPLLIFLLRTRRRIAVAATAGVLTSLTIRTLLVVTGFTLRYPFSVFSWTPSRLDGLFLGALLAIAVRSRFHHEVLRWSVPVLIAGCILLGVFFRFDPGLDALALPLFTTLGLTLLALTFAALIAACLRPRSLLQRFSSNATLRFFGRYSYGLYVYHYTISGLVITYLRPALLGHTGSKAVALIASGLVALLISVAVAWCSYTFFESRFLQLKRRFHDTSSRPKLQELVQS